MTKGLVLAAMGVMGFGDYRGRHFSSRAADCRVAAGNGPDSLGQSGLQFRHPRLPRAAARAAADERFGLGEDDFRWFAQIERLAAGLFHVPPRRRVEPYAVVRR